MARCHGYMLVFDVHGYADGPEQAVDIAIENCRLHYEIAREHAPYLPEWSEDFMVTEIDKLTGHPFYGWKVTVDA